MPAASSCRDTVGSKATEQMRVKGPWLPERSPEHEVQVHVEVSGLRQIARIVQPPLPASMFARNPTNGVPFSRKDRFGGLLDLGTLREHSRATQRADVVQIDVHGQPGITEHEQVQGRAPLQDPRTPKRWVGIEDIQEMHQMQGLLDDGRVEPAGFGRSQEFRCRESHGMSAHVRSRTSAGIIKFQPLTQWQSLRLLRIR